MNGFLSHFNKVCDWCGFAPGQFVRALWWTVRRCYGLTPASLTVAAGAGGAIRGRDVLFVRSQRVHGIHSVWAGVGAEHDWLQAELRRCLRRSQAPISHAARWDRQARYRQGILGRWGPRPRYICGRTEQRSYPHQVRVDREGVRGSEGEPGSDVPQADETLHTLGTSLCMQSSKRALARPPRTAAAAAGVFEAPLHATDSCLA
jgi:hypothetical protein